MKLFEFGIASIVDANTGFGLERRHSLNDIAAAELSGRTIRAKSFTSFFGLIRQRIAKINQNLKARHEARRNLKLLLDLDNRVLQDIKVSRADLVAVELGHMTLEEVDQNRGFQRRKSSRQSTVPLGKSDESLPAANQDCYHLADCA